MCAASAAAFAWALTLPPRPMPRGFAALKKAGNPALSADMGMGILNIDNDHLEYYGTMGRLKMAFQKFALLSRTVVFNMDDRNTVDVVNSIDRPVFSELRHQ